MKEMAKVFELSAAVLTSMVATCVALANLIDYIKKDENEEN